MSHHNADRMAYIRKALTAVRIAIEQEMKERREGVEIVKAMLCENPKLDGERIVCDDFIVCLDDIRKPICQLDYHGNEKMFVLFDVQEKLPDMDNMEGRFVEITGNGDLEKYKIELLRTLEEYLEGEAVKPTIME